MREAETLEHILRPLHVGGTCPPASVDILHLDHEEHGDQGPTTGGEALRTFRSVSYPHRVFAGEDAVARLGGEAERLDVHRVLVVSGRSVGADETNRKRIEQALGGRLSGWFDGIEKDSTFASVDVATEQARRLGADAIVAIGGGSVIVAARAIAIFLVESDSPFNLMTQYPEGQPAFSPRLDTPKPPIINIPTTPTTAMNRAGTGLKNDDLDHRMEYFDPKTRPAVLLWDEGYLRATPADVFCSAATTLFTGTAMGLGSLGDSPLADGDRRQAFQLAVRAYPKIGTPEDTVERRLELMTAAYLQSRIEDTGTNRGPRPRGHAYALATALHLLYRHVGQGEATAIMTCSTLALFPPGREELERMAEEMGVPANEDAIAGHLTAVYEAAGLPMWLRDLDIPREDFGRIAAATQKNFNANPGERDPRQVEEMLQILEHAW